jgi:hypothetical protein
MFALIKYEIFRCKIKHSRMKGVFIGYCSSRKTCRGRTDTKYALKSRPTSAYNNCPKKLDRKVASAQHMNCVMM